MKIEFSLNNRAVTVDVDPMQSLLQTLRNQLEQVAAKEGCSEGECGSCSVICNNVLVNACMMPTMQAQGAEIMTLEGIRESDRGICLMDAMVEAHAIQCGFCTPGVVMALYALLSSNAYPTENDIRSAISGNLCRCTGYTAIIEAAQIAMRKGEGLW